MKNKINFLLVFAITPFFIFLFKKILIFKEFKFSIYGLATNYIIPLLIIIFILFLIKTKNKELKINSLLIFYSVTFAIYLTEIFITSSLYLRQKRWISKTESQQGFFDKRSNLKVVEERREKGEEVYPITFSANASESIYINGKETLALSGVANSESIFCNETGKWESMKTDELGFSNRKGIWKESQIDLLIIGDSYGLSTCVGEKYRMHELLNRDYGKTINLSYSMNGPLIQLAVLREYGQIIKPKKIIWFYYGNDFYDLSKNIKNPILKSYLNKGFSQDLYRNRFKVNNEMKKLSLKTYKNYMDGSIEPVKINFEYDTNFMKIIKLSNLRKIIFNLFEEFKMPSNISFENYEEIFKLAIEESKQWNGEITFVYLPGYNELLNYKEFRVKNEYEVIKQKLLPMIKNLDVDVVDMTPVLFSKGGVKSFYHNPRSHYNKDGYKIISEEIIKSLLKN